MNVTAIDFAQAVALTAATGVRSVKSETGLDTVTLTDGRVIVHWHGDAELACVWEIRSC